MRRNLFLFVCLSLFFMACSKDDEDKLQGKWQLRQVTDLNTGAVAPVDTVWYNFMNSLFMYQVYDAADVDTTYRHAYGFKTWNADNYIHLRLTDYSRGTPRPITEFLPYTDWSSNERSFELIKVDGDELVLDSEGKQYLFHKF